MAAVPQDVSSKPQAADDVDEVFWAPVSRMQGMKGLTHQLYVPSSALLPSCRGLFVL